MKEHQDIFEANKTEEEKIQEAIIFLTSKGYYCIHKDTIGQRREPFSLANAVDNTMKIRF